MEIIDSKKKCCVEGCNCLGEWDKILGNRVYRRKKCSKHRRPHSYKSRNVYYREKFKKDNCGDCEYCGWEGPCDIHRPNPRASGGQYTKDNCRSICPNCHRLISYGLIVDKFRDVQKSEHIV